MLSAKTSTHRQTSLEHDSHGNPSKTTPRVRRRLSKRTPPVNQDSYSSYTFEFKWENKDSDGCGQTTDSCNKAFVMFANSPCGHQGGEQNGLTAAAALPIDKCGTFSYKITGPDVPPPSGPDSRTVHDSPPLPRGRKAHVKQYANDKNPGGGSLLGNDQDTTLNYKIEATVTYDDDSGGQIGHLDSTDAGNGVTVKIDGNTDSLSIKPCQKDDYVQFSLANNQWKSSDKGQCTVGGWDPRQGPPQVSSFLSPSSANADNSKTRQMDCSFTC